MSIKTISAKDSPADRLTEQITDYLLKETEDGISYLKSKNIAEELNVKPKEVAVRLSAIQHGPTPLEIEEWSMTRQTTWKISRTDK